MPIYEYQCTKHGHRFEVRHGVGETVERCEQCGAPVRRVFSPVGIIFKGPGFHVNDYRKTPAPSEGASSSSSATSSSSASPSASGGGEKSATPAAGAGAKPS